MNKAAATKAFADLIDMQFARIAQMGATQDFVDYKALPKIIIGIVGGDGIGPAITAQAERVLAFLLKQEVAEGKIVFRNIEGLTIENRVQKKQPIPDDVLAELKACHVILKGPTTTPQAGDSWPNIESANVAMRKHLDLFANVRPVCVPDQGIDWTFFRENTEGPYAVGSLGFTIENQLSIDFTVTTDIGCRRIIRTAFEWAKRNNKTRVTAVTKANVIKTTDGRFLEIFKEIAAEYPGIQADDWYADIVAAKLIDTKRRRDFQVFVMPNLYGDILTDEAAEFQGGVGTAGGANIGTRYAMFEAIHGSAPRMVEEGRAMYADPSSVMRAAAMLLDHIGYTEKAKQFNTALDICTQTEQKLRMTGRSDGATNEAFSDYVMETIGG